MRARHGKRNHQLMPRDDLTANLIKRNTFLSLFLKFLSYLPVLVAAKEEMLKRENRSITDILGADIVFLYPKSPRPTGSKEKGTHAINWIGNWTFKWYLKLLNF